MSFKYILLLSYLTQVVSSYQTIPPFQRFAFAPNNVCIQPQVFQVKKNMTTTQGQVQDLKFTMRNVPGEGDCVFLAVALATSTSMGLGGNNAFLRSIAADTRSVVADVMDSKGNLHIDGNRLVRAKDLLRSAAKNEGLDCVTYIEHVRNGNLQGGGPELTVLSNVLRRPISIYELDWKESGNAEDDKQTTIPDVLDLKHMGTFGDIFKDPLSKISNPAVLSGLQQGAYSWHIHILVVDAGLGEKHACALLPKECYV